MRCAWILLLLSARFWAAQEAPPAAEQARIIEEARRVALTYTESLPDFICAESVKRYEDFSGKPKEKWRLKDTLLLQVSFSGRQESYRLVAVNKVPVDRPYKEMGGAITQGEFGTLLHEIFDESSQTEFHWLRWDKVRNRATHVYSFRVRPENSSFRLEYGDSDTDIQNTIVGQHGLVYIDRESGQVVRIEADADIPEDFAVKGAATVLDYDFADVAGRKYLLPLRADVRMRVRRVRTRNDVEFLEYQKFAADAKITFQGK